MIFVSNIKKVEFNKADTFLCLDEFFDAINKLKSNGYIFRGHEKSSFLLQPSAFRPDKIIIREKQYSSKAKNYNEWDKSDQYNTTVKLIKHAEEAVLQTDVIRITELTKFKLIYNYFLSISVQNDPEKFDKKTREMYEIRKPNFWLEEDTFHYFFHSDLSRSTTLISLKNTIIQKGEISEEIAGYDESLPQHYDTETAALDWSRNPLKGLYFSTTKKSNEDFSLYAYKEIKNTNYNFIVTEEGNPGCINERISAQEGLFTKFKYACIYWVTAACPGKVHNLICNSLIYN